MELPSVPFSILRKLILPSKGFRSFSLFFPVVVLNVRAILITLYFLKPQSSVESRKIYSHHRRHQKKRLKSILSLDREAIESKPANPFKCSRDSLFLSNSQTFQFDALKFGLHDKVLAVVRMTRQSQMKWLPVLPRFSPTKVYEDPNQNNMIQQIFIHRKIERIMLSG